MPGAGGRSAEPDPVPKAAPKAEPKAEPPPADNSWLEMETVRGIDVELAEDTKDQA